LFESLSSITFLTPTLVRHDPERRPRWTARDAAVIKEISEELSKTLPQSAACTHLRGNGGLKETIRRVQRALGQHHYVFRTDIKSYYASIDHFKLMDQLAEHVTDRDTLNLLWQYMHRTVEFGGTFREIKRGIPAGCSLSPLIGAFHLHALDVEMTTKHTGCFYIRYMDDILILAPSRWRLRRAIAGVKGHLSTLGLELHPDKTSMGSIARGFDFLGYQHDCTGLRLSHITLQRHQEKLTRLYEQYHRQLRAYRSGWVGQSTILREATDPAQAYLNPQPSIKSHEDITRLLEAYLRRFTAWAQGGLPSCEIGYEQL
jgi:RNA-directed DNA polymerase